MLRRLLDWLWRKQAVPAVQLQSKMTEVRFREPDEIVDLDDHRTRFVASETFESGIVFGTTDGLDELDMIYIDSECSRGNDTEI